MSAAIFFTPLPTNTLVLASQFTTFQDYFNLYKYFGCWNFDLFKTNYHRKKQHPSTTLTLYCLGCRLTKIEVFTSYSHLVWWPLRGWNSRHNQNMWYIVLCIQIPLSWTTYTGKYFWIQLPNCFFSSTSSQQGAQFLPFCIDTAVPEADVATCNAWIWFKVLSKSTAKIILFSMRGGLSSPGTHSSASDASTFTSQDLHGFSSQHPIAFSPFLVSAQWYKQKNLHECL